MKVSEAAKNGTTHNESVKWGYPLRKHRDFVRISYNGGHLLESLLSNYASEWGTFHIYETSPIPTEEKPFLGKYVAQLEKLKVFKQSGCT